MVFLEIFLSKTWKEESKHIQALLLIVTFSSGYPFITFLLKELILARAIKYFTYYLYQDIFSC